jgi:hypothetical protein
VRIIQFNISDLKRDRDQLWAEAAMLEKQGGSIRLDVSLWLAAAEEQGKRFTADPYLEALQHALRDTPLQSKIASEDLWVILDVRPGQRSQDQSRRLNEAMQKLGWVQNSNRTIKVHGQSVTGFSKGSVPWQLIHASRTRDDGLKVDSVTEAT